MRRATLLLLASLAAADKWAAFGEKEWKNGTRRLVVNESGFRLLDGEKVVATGTLPQLPLGAHVLADGGAVLFEKYAAIGYGDTLSLLGADGKLAWRLTLEEAIPGGAGGAAVSTSSIHWYRTWSVDEARGVVLLVAKSGVLSEVHLATGKPNKPRAETLLDALAMPLARDAALEALVELVPEGLREAAEKLRAEYDLPATTRLRAAVAAEKDGGDAVTRATWQAALADGVGVADRQAVVRFAGKHVGDVSLVEKAALRKDVGMQAVEALFERKAARELAGLLTHASLDAAVRARAAELLAQQAPEAIAEAVDKEMEDADARQGGALLAAAIASKAPDLESRLQHHETLLLKILDKETADVSWLAGYFKGRPTSEAVQPLLRSLSRHRNDPALKKKLIAALKPCSGEDFGDDADAWIKGLGKR